MVRTTVAAGPRLGALLGMLTAEIHRHPDAAVPAEAVLGWAAGHPHAVEGLRPAGDPAAYLRPVDSAERHELAALSGVLELLALPYQGGGEAYQGDGEAGRDAYPGFAAATGLTRVAEDVFHPFFHEIVEVEQADDPDEPISLLDEVWPGYLLGSLLVARAGVRVRAGTAYAHAAVATRSRLHWAGRRRRRDTHAFAFRRDYRTADALYYNVDAQPESVRVGCGEPPLTSAERLELLRHRCVLRRPEAAAAAWPWAGQLRYCEPIR